ncbi:MAG: ATP-binding protein [Syntrophobacteraceae bacterium]|nr:ATP-binding protein [Syntrophobacteraceae bacterium]
MPPSWKSRPISLRTRIALSLLTLVGIALAGGIATAVSVNRISAQVAAAVNEHATASHLSQKLKTSLSMQKGLLAYHMLDADPAWMQELDQQHREFEQWLRKAREMAREDADRAVLNDIESGYLRYSYARERAVERSRAGGGSEGLGAGGEMQAQFSAILGLCELYGEMQTRKMEEGRSHILNRVRFIKVLAFLTIGGVAVLGLVLHYTLMDRVLKPLRRMALAAGPDQPQAPVVDEVKALSLRVQSLMQDVDQTQSALQQSREHLLQAEKLASVGKLAAGVAHSIRNPLTSVKMRLFSMERTLELTPAQREDIEVISEEIRHIDTIVRNFLEYSRPPKLKLQNVSPSDVVDAAIQLLRHRIESYGVEVEVYRQRRLPEVEGDPEQLKEVLVNLMVNACEAMADGGKITIREEEGRSEPMGRVTVVRVSDTGPGVPEAIKEMVFQPFFSTKEEGTGLGLSIAERIIHDHKGCLNLRSREGKGATFIITLPCLGDIWLRY